VVDLPYSHLTRPTRWSVAATAAAKAATRGEEVDGGWWRKRETTGSRNCLAVITRNTELGINFTHDLFYLFFIRLRVSCFLHHVQLVIGVVCTMYGQCTSI
jgi:hypothetical protein